MRLVAIEINDVALAVLGRDGCWLEPGYAGVLSGAGTFGT